MSWESSEERIDIKWQNAPGDEICILWCREDCKEDAVCCFEYLEIEPLHPSRQVWDGSGYENVIISLRR